MDGACHRPLPMMLRDLTTDRMGNSVLSDDVTLESLVPITRNLNHAQLEQCMNIAKRNALNRLWLGAPHIEALHEVDILVTMGDFVLALADVNG
ncbi:unnamed protein product [Sphagnum troendelagicum]|uniref:Uncharacterized protein n=1 Tax=Sphagnum troendelagicum TaxID=128251 RepID=A0ABP0UAG3_9BRYO